MLLFCSGKYNVPKKVLKMNYSISEKHDDRNAMRFDYDKNFSDM